MARCLDFGNNGGEEGMPKDDRMLVEEGCIRELEQNTQQDNTNARKEVTV